MSSSHLFLGLPIALLVFYLELRSGFHSAAFFSHLSHGEVAILSANFHFIFFVGPVPATNLCTFHLVQSVSSASLYVFDPVFFFNQCGINLIVGIVFK